MPKLLQKNIYKASLTTAMLCIPVIVIFVGGILHHGKIAAVFNVINLFFLVLEQTNLEQTNNEKSMFRFTLPDFMFIAPYSREQREKLIKKGMLYKLMAIYDTILLFVIAPIMIYEIIIGEVMGIIFCFAEAILIFTLLYNRMFIKYLFNNSKGVSAYIVIQVITFLQYSMFAGLAATSNHIGETNRVFEVIQYHIGEIVLIGILIVVGVIICIFCRIKYYKPMVCYMADYEKFKDIK